MSETKTENLPEDACNDQPATSNKPETEISTVFSLSRANTFKLSKFDF